MTPPTVTYPLGAALTAYAEIVGDAILAAGQPPPERVLRYHGHAPPEDLECGRVLAVWWEGPALTPADQGKCSGPLSVSLAAKYVMCWKPAKVKANSTILLYDDQWDTDAGTLALVAEVVARRLIRLQCHERGDPFDSDYDAAMLDLVRSPRFVGATPTGPTTAAGIIWRLQGGIYGPTPVPETS